MSDPIATLLMTRPARASERFLRDLDLPGIDVLISPLLRIVEREGAIDLSAVDALVLSSMSAVDVLERRQMRFDGPAFCVGDATAQAAQAVARTVHSAAGDAESLKSMIIRETVPGTQLCHLRGAHSRGNIAAELTRAERPCREQVIYDQEPESLCDAARAVLDGPNPVLLPVFSPRTAMLFSATCPWNAQIYVIAISEAVVNGLGDHTFGQVLVADAPEAEAMRRAVRAARDMLIA